MIDQAADKTEKKLKQIENRLKKLYKESEADVTKAWTEYITAQDDKIERLKEAYGNAKDFGTAEDVKRIGKELGVARAERTLQNQYYKDMVAETTRKLAGVNQQALAYLNGQMFWVYAENFNQAAKDADKVGFRFDMVDEATVRRRVMDGDIKLPKKKLSVPKDMRWNTKQLNSAVLQGIVNGESMDKIAARIYPIVDNNAASAIRNARTMVTGAQNQGRQDSYKMMSDMGIVLKKVWMATPDDRTRESHIDLDGEAVDYDKEFSNGLMYPGDPNGDASEVWNCRCTMTTEIIGLRKADGRIERVGELDKDDFHEQQIEEERERRNEDKNLSDQEEQLPKNITESLISAYTKHNTINKLHRASIEEMQSSKILDNIIGVDFGNISRETKEAFSDTITELIERYDTPLQKIRTISEKEFLGHKNTFAFVNHDYRTDSATLVLNPGKVADYDKMLERLAELKKSGYIPNIKDENLGSYVPTHEFLHTVFDTGTALSDKTNWVNADYEKIRKVRKEVGEVYDEYISHIGKLEQQKKDYEFKYIMNMDESSGKKARDVIKELNSVQISSYSKANADEFMAESFVFTEFGEGKNEYAERAKGIIDKYFRR